MRSGRGGGRGNKQKKANAEYSMINSKNSNKNTAGYLMGDFAGRGGGIFVCLFVHTSQADPGRLT